MVVTKIRDDIRQRKQAAYEAAEQMNKAETTMQGIGTTIKFASKAIRLGMGILTAPVVFGLRVVSKALPVVWEMAAQIVDIPASLISRVVKNDSPYNGQVTRKVGDALGKMGRAIFEETSTVVQKMF